MIFQIDVFLQLNTRRPYSGTPSRKSEKGLLLFFAQNEVEKRHPIHQLPKGGTRNALSTQRNHDCAAKPTAVCGCRRCRWADPACCHLHLYCTVNKTATSRLPQVHLCKQVRLTRRLDVFIFLCFYTLPFLSSVCSRFSSADCLARIAFTLSYRSSIIISVFKLTL